MEDENILKEYVREKTEIIERALVERHHRDPFDARHIAEGFLGSETGIWQEIARDLNDDEKATILEAMGSRAEERSSKMGRLIELKGPV